MKTKIFIITLFILLSSPFLVLAYSENTIGGDLAAQISPTNPEPGQMVSITLRGYGFDLDSSMISWSVDGKASTHGTGAKSYEFKIKSLREATKVDILVQTPQQKLVRKQIIFYPNSADLIWETNTYTPAFYKGKALPTSESDIKVVAIPDFIDRNGTPLKSSQLVFKWKKDGRYYPAASGIGKDYFIFKSGDSEAQHLIEVEISDSKGEAKLLKNISIPLSQPEIIFYEKKPLEGINYNQALSQDFLVSKDEVVVRAEPYFFSLKKAFDLVPTWSLNDEKVQYSDNDPWSIVLRTKKGSEGVNKLRIDFQNINSNFQRASNAILVKFKNPS